MHKLLYTSLTSLLVLVKWQWYNHARASDSEATDLKPGWIIAGFAMKSYQHYKASLDNSQTFVVQPRVHVG